MVEMEGTHQTKKPRSGDIMVEINGNHQSKAA